MAKLLSWVLGIGLEHLRLQDNDLLVLSGSNSQQVAEQIVRSLRRRNGPLVSVVAVATNATLQVLDDKALAGIGLMRIPQEFARGSL